MIKHPPQGACESLAEEASWMGTFSLCPGFLSYPPSLIPCWFLSLSTGPCTSLPAFPVGGGYLCPAHVKKCPSSIAQGQPPKEDFDLVLLPLSGFCSTLQLCLFEKCQVKPLCRVQIFWTPWTVAHQVPSSMGFSRQEYWSGVPLPSPGYNLWGHKRVTHDLVTKQKQQQ